jgi:inner membrane protein
MILWPNRTRLALDHLFIIDPWYWGLLALPILFSYFYKSRRAAICSGGIVLVLLYHGLAAFNHHEAIFILKKDKPGASVLAFPQPFSPFRWSAFSRGNGLLKNARIDFLKSAQPLEWQQWPEPPITPNIKAAMESPEGKRYLWFARVPLWEEEKQPDGSVEVGFWDLRFQNNFTKERVTKRFKTVIKVKDGRVIDSR